MGHGSSSAAAQRNPFLIQIDAASIDDVSDVRTPAPAGGDGSNSHVFQLHGYSFYVVGRGSGRGLETERGSWEALAAADREGRLLKRHLDRPVLKDTVVVPHLGAVAFRFVADNPGETNRTIKDLKISYRGALPSSETCPRKQPVAKQRCRNDVNVSTRYCFGIVVL